LRFALSYEAPYKREREWRDDKGGRLEDRVTEIFAAFFAAAADQKRERAEWEETQRRRAEEQHRAWEREQERQREQDQIEILRAAA
jgi:hypothetical protein